MKNQIRWIAVCLPLLCVSTTARAQGAFKVSEGTVVSINEATLHIGNMDLENEGKLKTRQGSLYLSTVGLDTEIRGNTLELHKLSIDAQDAKIQLSASLKVETEVRLVQGILDLVASDLTLGETAGRIVGERNESRITATQGGEIVKTLVLNAPNQANPGQLGLEISCGQSFGRTEIRRGHEVAPLPSGMSISRYYRIVPEVRIQEDIDLRFLFFSSERSDNSMPDQLWKKKGTRWVSMRKQEVSVNESVNWLSAIEFEFGERYTVGPEEEIVEELSSIPTAFTPNADGRNDFFEIPWIQHHPEARVSIFDRWGNHIFSSTQYHKTPWDGHYKGKLLPPSSFYYVVKFSTSRKPLKGNISIIR